MKAYFNLPLALLFTLTTQLLNAQISEIARKNYLDTLTSKAFFGRGYLKEGDKKAASFLEQEYKKIGLKPFGKSYFQEFALNINTFPKTPKLKINTTTLKLAKEFLPNSTSGKGKGKAELLVIEEKQIDSLSKSEAFLASDLSKQAIYITSTAYGKIISEYQYLADKLNTSKCILFKQSKLTHSVAMNQSSKVLLDIMDSIPIKTGDKIKFKVKPEFVRNYISQNVIGYIEGTDEPNKFLAISAHYDHLGGIGKKIYFPGANDNASGISMLLSLADSLSKNHLPYSVIVFAFGAEEVGLVGSKYFVEHPYFSLENIEFLFNLDLMGTGDEGATVVNGSVYKNEFNYLLTVNKKLQDKGLPSILSRGTAANSDHFFFSLNGVKSFFMYLRGGIQAYHDVNDKASTLPFTKFDETLGVVYNFLKYYHLQKFED